MKIDSRVLLDWTEKYYREHARKAKEEGLAWSADEARLRAFCDTRHQWELLYGTWDGGGTMRRARSVGWVTQPPNTTTSAYTQ